MMSLDAVDSRLVVLLLLLAVIVMFQGQVWFEPKVNDYYPTNDCGKNWSLALQWDPNRHCELLVVSDEVVEEVRRMIQKEDPHQPGEIRFSDSLDEALKWIEELLRGFQ
jgi:hypothetical protein